MVNNKFIKDLKTVVYNNGIIFLVGRGSSARHVDFTKINKYDSLIVGFNLSCSATIPCNYYYFSAGHDIGSQFKIDETLNADCLSEDGNKRAFLEVGSIDFELGGLLSFIDQNIFEIKRKKIKIFLAGFDFRSNTRDDDLLGDPRDVSPIQRKINIESQLIALEELNSKLLNLELIRLSFDINSSRDPRNFLTELQPIPQANKVEIVAEITTNHHGEKDKLVQLITSAKHAGADSVKLQLRNVEKFYTQRQLESEYKSPFGNTFRDYRNQLELSDDQIEIAYSLSRDLDISLFFSVLDKDSFIKILNYSPQRIKLPSTISRKTDFLKYVAKNYFGEIVISTGMTDNNYEKFVLDNFSKVKKLYLLHCISAYPTWPGDVNLSNITRYKELVKTYKHIVPGYSSHDIGEIISLLAISAGARMIEKHIKIGSTEWVHFDDTAMDIKTEFPNFVKMIRNVERIIGSDKKTILPIEHHKY